MRAVGVFLIGAMGCARSENTQPTSGVTPVASETAEAAAPPAVSTAPSAAPVASTPSPLNGPCWVSLVRKEDGKPAAEQKCAPGLACDFRDAVPDGPGRCRRR
jgi:hypothetical protein